MGNRILPSLDSLIVVGGFGVQVPARSPGHEMVAQGDSDSKPREYAASQSSRLEAELLSVSRNSSRATGRIEGADPRRVLTFGPHSTRRSNPQRHRRGLDPLNLGGEGILITRCG